MKKSFLFLAVSTVLLFSGCSKDESPNKSELDQRFLFVNEGSYSDATSSIMAVNTDNSISEFLFKGANHRPLGSTGQSIVKIGDKYFITVSNSGKIEVVSVSGFKQVKTIMHPDKNIHFAPYSILQISDNRVVVSDVFGNMAWILDTESLSIVGKIDLGMTSQEMTVGGGKLFVSVSQWDNDSFTTLTALKVVSLDDLTSVRTIDIKPSHRTRIYVEGDDLYVLTSEGVACINVSTEKLTKTIKVMGGVTIPEYNTSLCLKDGFLFFNGIKGIDKVVLKASLSDSTFPTEVMFKISGTTIAYNMYVTPENTILICDPIDYTQSGAVCEYTFTGVLLHRFNVGVSPFGVCFK